jgi:hypothetical protein
MNSGGDAVTLGDLAGRFPMLEVACSRCSRRSWLSIARLVQEHGADAPLTELNEVLVSGCPRLDAVLPRDRCGVYYPRLV